MDLQEELYKAPLFENLPLLARQVVEGYISGIHKSPFHGYSAEFAEHKIYNAGESTKHLDWKVYAKTDKLYTKRYEEETNLRCHIIVDNSPSMYYPLVKELKLSQLNKMGFAVLAAAAIMNLLKKQRDAVGLSVFSDHYPFHAPEKGSERHHHMLMDQLNKIGNTSNSSGDTKLYTYLHQIAEKLKRRTLVLLFTDMLQTQVGEPQLFDALRHLKYNKHEVVLFHLLDQSTETSFDFDNSPKRFVDVETGSKIDLYPDTVKAAYRERMEAFLSEIKTVCGRYKIQYQEIDIQQPFDRVLNTFMVERQSF